MRLEQTKREVQTVGVMERAKATIKATPKIFSFFENSTYSNKPRAIARELVANGVDSHTEAGCPHRAVELTLPCELDPIFKVRDFGVGMTHEFLMGPYMAYTDGSTKDQSNNQIGGFGIGSKSPFAYTDQYTVRSVRDGQLGVYVVAKDEDGIPEIGCLGRTATTEPSGVEVSFPVEIDDIGDFIEAAQEALQYFRPLPAVINGTIDAPDYSYEGKDWAIRRKSGSLGVIMGGVRYPVTTASLEYALRVDTRLSPLLEYGIDLWMPIGSCGVALSREALQYDGSTSANIKAKLEELIDEVVLTFSNMFDNEPTLWEAKKALIKHVGSNQDARSRLMLAHAQYHGQPLSMEVRVPSGSSTGSGWYILAQGERRAATSLKKMTWEDLAVLPLNPGKIGAVFVDDMPQTPKSKIGAKIREWVDENGQAHPVIVLRAYGDNTDPTRIRVLLAGIGNPQDVIYTSSLPEPAKVARNAPNKERPRVRMFTFNGQNDKFTHATITNLQPSMSKASAVREIAYVNQPGSGILVVMNAFDLPADFNSKMAAGLIDYDELHFVNVGDAPKLDKANWPRFEDVFKQRLDDALAEYPELPQRLALHHNADLTTWFRRIDSIYNRVSLTSAQLRRPFGRIWSLFETYIKPLTTAQHKLAPFVTAALPPRIEPAKLVEAVDPDVDILFNRLELDNSSELALLVKNL